MEKLIHAIQDWPVLIQGAVGSALFWLVLVLGQKLATFSSQKISALSTQRRKSMLLDELLRFQAVKTEAGPYGGYFASILWFRASRHLTKALIWLTMGLIFDAIFPVLGIVGFVGCLYYLFATLNVVRPSNFTGDIDEKIREIEEKLAEFDRT